MRFNPRSFLLPLIACTALGLKAGDPADMPPSPTPSPEHAKLAEGAGTWDTVIKMYMQPGKPPEVSNGVEVSRMDLGGFWLISEFKSEWMGQPFMGRGQVGYDQIRKVYVSSWIDCMSSTMMTMRGNYLKDGKTLVMYGKGPHESGKKFVDYKEVMTDVDADHHNFKMYVAGAKKGQWKLVMEIDYTRHQ